MRRGTQNSQLITHTHEFMARFEVFHPEVFLTPCCRVLLDKLTGLQLVNKFPSFHGTRRFITALTSVHHLSLSWTSPIQSIYPHPTSWRSILILSTHLRLDLLSGHNIHIITIRQSIIQHLYIYIYKMVYMSGRHVST